MTYIRVIPDRFKDVDEKSSYWLANSNRSGRPYIRRPTRGIQLKEETFATLRVVTAVNGLNQVLVDAGSRRTGENDTPLTTPDGKHRATDIYSNFILQSVQREQTEKSQVLETFGEAVVFLFGERPRVMSFSGILANTQDFNWEAEWWHNYDNYLRGTRCVENDAQVFLSFDQTMVRGYVLSAASTKTAQERNYVQFQFQMLVTDIVDLSSIGDPFTNLTDKEVAPLSYEDSKPFRPRLIDDFGRLPTPARGYTVGADGKVQMPTLREGLLENLAKVTQAWRDSRAVSQSALSGSTDAYVRIPVGFAGSFEFDADDLVQIKDPAPGSVLKYSTYDKNDDEYVGVGDHYGTSDPRSALSKWIQNSGYLSTAESIELNHKFAKKVAAVWGSPDVSVYTNPDMDRVMASFLLSGSVGLAKMIADISVVSAVGATLAIASVALPHAAAIAKEG